MLNVKVAAVEACPLLIVEVLLPTVTIAALALFPFKLNVLPMPIARVPVIEIEFAKAMLVPFTVKLFIVTVPLPGKAVAVAPDANTIVPLLVMLPDPPVNVPFIVSVTPVATVKVPPTEIFRLLIVSLLSTAKVPEDMVILATSGSMFAAANRNTPPFIR